MFSILKQIKVLLLGESFPTSQKFAQKSPSTLPQQTLIHSPKVHFLQLNNSFHCNPIKTSFLALAIAPVPFFILTSSSLYTKITLVLMLIDVQYLQNVVFSFEKASNVQNHSSSDPHHSIKSSLQQNFQFSLKIPISLPFY